MNYEKLDKPILILAHGDFGVFVALSKLNDTDFKDCFIKISKEDHAAPGDVFNKMINLGYLTKDDLISADNSFATIVNLPPIV